MSEEDLQLLITLDDPVELPDEDVFHHLHLIFSNSETSAFNGGPDKSKHNIGSSSVGPFD